MGRFSWGAGAKSRDMRVSRKETPVAVEAAGASSSADDGEQGKGDAAVAAPKYLWVLALCAAAVVGYCLEATPVRVSNAMFSNHLFSVNSHLLPRILTFLLLPCRQLASHCAVA